MAWKWVKEIFSPSTIRDTAKSAIAGLDSVVFTNQEKTQLYAELWKAAVPSALSRRIIAGIMVSVWAFMIIVMMFVFPFSTVWAEFLLELFSVAVVQPVNIIVGFYFLKQVVTEFGVARGVARNAKGTKDER